MRLKWLIPTRKSYRSLRTDIEYIRHRLRGGNSSCPFCDSEKTESAEAFDHRKWRVIKNDFPYKKWDWNNVSDHRMLIPKQHLEELGKIDEASWQEFGEIVSDYDEQGYSVYLRSRHNELKTVPHLHWHLIKID